MSRLQIPVMTCCLLAISVTGFAQGSNATVTQGFDFLIPAYASGEERQAQPNLWVHSLRFKTVRMLQIEVTDPKTKLPRTDLVYYVVYEAINREIERNAEDPATTPANAFDAPPGPELFVPEITLVIEDEVTELLSSDYQRVLRDEVIPEAQKRIEARERMKVRNSVQAVGPVPAASPKDDPQPSAYYGVAMFRKVDPKMDFFRLVFSGFSNGYKLVKGPVSYAELKTLAADGTLKVSDQVWNGDQEQDWRASAEVGDLFNARKSAPANADASDWYYSVSPDRGDATARVWRKTLVVHYWRPGDEFDQNEREVRRKGEPRWIYVPDDAPAAPAAAEPASTASVDNVKAAQVASLPAK